MLTYADIRPEHLGDVGRKVADIAALAQTTSIPLNPGIVVTVDVVAALTSAAGATDVTPSLAPAVAAQWERWWVRLGVAAGATVVVRTSLIRRHRPDEEIEGVGTSRVCTVTDVRTAMVELVDHLRLPAQRARLAALGSGPVDVAVLINPFPHHDAAGVCTSYDVTTGSTDRFEVHLGHGQLYGITRGYTSTDAYLVDRRHGTVLSFEPGHAHDAVELDDDGRYAARPLAAERRATGVAASLGVDVEGFARCARHWVADVSRATGHDRFCLEFCIDRRGAVIVTDVRYG